MESTPVTAPADPPMKALVQDDDGTAQRRRTTLSVRRTSIVAGTGYLLLSILAGFGNYGVLAQWFAATFPETRSFTTTTNRDLDP
jgi:hypothetical protein